LNDPIHKAVLLLAMAIGLGSTLPVSADDQDLNRESGATFGPLSFTEPNQNKAASLANRPTLQVNRLPPPRRLFGNIMRNPGGVGNTARRFHPIDDGTSSFDSSSSYMGELPEWSFGDPGLDRTSSHANGLYARQLGFDNKDLSNSYNAKIEGTSALTGTSYSTKTGDWTPSKVDLYSNGGFGIRAPNGIIDMPPPNGHVEETF
jgi:hypothetical protein